MLALTLTGSLSWAVPPLCDPYLKASKDCNCEAAPKVESPAQAVRDLREIIMTPKTTNAPNTLGKTLAQSYQKDLQKWKRVQTYLDSKKRKNLNLAESGDQQIVLDRLKTEYQLLIKADLSVKETEEKHRICLTECSAPRRLELEKEIADFQKIKFSLMARNPIFLNKSLVHWVDRNVKPMGKNEISSEGFESLLAQGVEEHISTLQSKISDVKAFLSDYDKKPKERQWIDSKSEFPAKFPSQFYSLTPDLLNQALSKWENLNSPDRSLYCQTWVIYDKAVQSQKTNQEVAQGAFAVTALVGTALTRGLSRFGGKLFTPGTVSAVGTGVGAGLAQGGSAALALSEAIILATNHNECRQKKSSVQINPSVSGVKDSQVCDEELEDETLEALAAGGSAGAVGLIRHIQKVRNFRSLILASDMAKPPVPVLGKTGAFTVKTSEQHFVTTVDLAKVPAKDKSAMDALYWDYLQFYKQQLQRTMAKFGRRDPGMVMSEQELDKMISGAWAMRERTVFAVKTDAAPFSENRRFMSGMAHVRAQNTSETLPSDDAFKLPRENGKGVEIGRLSVDSTLDEAERKKSIEDLVQIYRPVLARDAGVGPIGIRTSVKHKEYYKHTFKELIDEDAVVNDRDVILKITPAIRKYEIL